MAIDWSDAPEFGRTNTIKHALNSLYILSSRLERGVTIVETGTTRGSLGGGLVGDGWATLAFGWFCKKYGGSVYTIDMNRGAIEECREITKDYSDVIHYIVSDSVKYLKTFNAVVDFLYLDSADDPQIIMNELLAVYDNISEEALIVIDDTHDGMTRGKGVLACQYLLQNGWRLLLDDEGQVIFSNTGLIINTTSYVPSRYSLDLYEYIQYTAEGDRIKLRLEDYDEKAKIWQEVFFSWMPGKEVPKIDGVRKVLDLGTNTGYNAKLLESIYGYAVGIDINEQLIEYSKLNHDKCYMMRAEDLAFEDDSFSLVVAKDLIEHTLDPDGVFNEAYRVLVDGGYFVCMVPLDGELLGFDDVSLHPLLSSANVTHTWKATLAGAMKRVFNAGFTEVEFGIVNHSELFGAEPRIYGDRVCIIRAQKKKDVIRVPIKWLTGNYFWAAFVTMGCTGNCSYCIQHFSKNEFMKARAFYEKNKISSVEWIEFYNKLQKYKNQQLSITGGEPLLYDGLFGMLEEMRGYYKTITTNLCAAAVGKFKTDISEEAKRSIRINTSFHPNITNVEDFCNKVHSLRDLGYTVDQVAMVDHPLSNFKKYYKEFLSRGITLAPQTYLGFVDDVLLPNPEYDIGNDYHEHGINNIELYNEGFSYKQKHDVLCMTRRFMVAPNGNIYNCHYHLYSNRSPMGNIKDGELPTVGDYEECSDYGFCNPCDFNHVDFRPMVVQLPDIVMGITKSEELTNRIISFITTVGGEFEKFIATLASELYISADGFWKLYTDESLKEYINNFIKEGGYVDNFNALTLANLEVNLFRCLPNGINLYRILDYEALCKYVDALSSVILKTFGANTEIINKLYDEELYNSFGSEVAAVIVSLGMARFADKRIHIMRRNP